MFYKAITEVTIHKMYCNTCETDIFPSGWTNDVDQVLAYQKRAVAPKPKFSKLKQTGWTLVIVILLIL